MESANSRGQCSLELVLVLILLTGVVFALHQSAKRSRDIFKPVMLSYEVASVSSPRATGT
jgi:hypothetical protein